MSSHPLTSGKPAADAAAPAAAQTAAARAALPLSPYIGGALTGVLMVASVWLSGKFFGTSTTFSRLSAGIAGLFAPEHVAQLAYFEKHGFKLDWQLWFVIGIGLGALAASLLSRTWRWQGVPAIFAGAMGGDWRKRAAYAFIGGVIAIIGVRMANGCPSGHGLSGMIQFAASGVLALPLFFLGGMGVARLLYGRTAADGGVK